MTIAGRLAWSAPASKAVYMMLPQHIVASPCALVLLMNVGPGVSKEVCASCTSKLGSQSWYTL